MQRTLDATPLSTTADVRDVLDCEKLDAYRVAEEFQVLVSTLIPRTQRVLRDQLERASTSCVLNIAEGCARWSRRERRHHYTIARGSMMESAAIVRLAYLRGFGDSVTCRRARSLAVRVIQMLTRLQASLV